MNNENVQNMANEITGITDSLCEENQKEREHRLGPNFFTNQTLRDKTIYSRPYPLCFDPCCDTATYSSLTRRVYCYAWSDQSSPAS